MVQLDFLKGYKENMYMVVLLPVFYSHVIGLVVCLYVCHCLGVFFKTLMRIHMVKVYCISSTYHENPSSLSPAIILYKNGAANHL